MSENNNAGTPFLKVQDLAVEYMSNDKVVHAVNGVSLELERGQTLGLVGETGAGKTTIAKSILRILPDVGAKVTGGKVILDGDDLFEMSEHEMRKVRGNKISMIFQDPMTALNPVQRVGEQIEEVVQLHNKGTKEEFVERAKEMLEMVGIPADRYYEYPHQFSGGMKQRVIIAMALACNPDLLLADEPTTALDVTIQAQILDLLRVYMEQEGRGILISSHISSDLEGLCDDLYMIHEGKIVLHEDMDVLLDQYGLLKVEKKDFSDLDKRGILRVAEESWGYSCLTNEKQFYLENYPGLVVERGSVDEIISMISKGEKL